MILLIPLTPYIEIVSKSVSRFGPQSQSWSLAGTTLWYKSLSRTRIRGVCRSLCRSQNPSPIIYHRSSLQLHIISYCNRATVLI